MASTSVELGRSTNIIMLNYKRKSAKFTSWLVTVCVLWHPIQCISSMHHYQCTVLYKDINLKRGLFSTSSLASCSSRSREERSPWMVFM